MATVRVVLRKSRKLKDGRYQIVIRLTHKKKVKYIFTGYSALEKEWNGKYHSYLNNNHTNQKELNQYFFRKYSEVNSQLLNYERVGKPYNVYDFHATAIDKPSLSTLFTFSEGLIAKLIKSGRIGNYRVY
jgi:hypothetical protein